MMLRRVVWSSVAARYRRQTTPVLWLCASSATTTTTDDGESGHKRPLAVRPFEEAPDETNNNNTSPKQTQQADRLRLALSRAAADEEAQRNKGDPKKPTSSFMTSEGRVRGAVALGAATAFGAAVATTLAGTASTAFDVPWDRVVVPGVTLGVASAVALGFATRGFATTTLISTTGGRGTNGSDDDDDDDAKRPKRRISTRSLRKQQKSASQRGKGFFSRFIFGDNSKNDDDVDDVDSPSTSFTFTLLNDDAQLEEAKEALEALAPSKEPAKVKALFDEAALKAKRFADERAKTRLDAVVHWASDVCRVKEEDDQSSSSAAISGNTKDGDVLLTETHIRDARASLRPRCFVADFDVSQTARELPPSQSGLATRVCAQRLEAVVSMVLAVAGPKDEFVLRVSSPGGAVSEYGWAASTFARLRRAGVKTVACVDTVAASGGFMLAAVAERVAAAPFSYVGSVGVVAELPNVKKILDKAGVDWYTFTAGKYKRTVSVAGDIDDDAKRKFQQQLDDAHHAFLDHVAAFRPDIVGHHHHHHHHPNQSTTTTTGAGNHHTMHDDNPVATGEVWLAVQAPPGLVDDLATSAEVLREKMRHADVIHVQPTPPSPRRPTFFHAFFDAAHDAAARLFFFAGPPTTLWGSPHYSWAQRSSQEQHIGGLPPGLYNSHTHHQQSGGSVPPLFYK